MMDERTLEEKLDEMLAEAARMAEEEPVEIDVKTTDDGKEIVFSKEHERKMKKIFAMAEDYEKSKKKLEREIKKIDERADKRHRKMAKAEKKAEAKEAKKALEASAKAEREKKSKDSALGFVVTRRAAIVTCIAVLIIGAAITPTTGAWRKGIAKFIFKPAEEYSEFKNVKDNENTAEVDGVKFYYVPKGFTFEEEREKFGTKCIMFSDASKGLFFDFKLLGQSRDIKVNTESGEIKDISTNERDMILVKNDKEMYITWQDVNGVYVLDGNCGEDILKKIAENIKFVQK